MHDAERTDDVPADPTLDDLSEAPVAALALDGLVDGRRTPLIALGVPPVASPYDERTRRGADDRNRVLVPATPNSSYFSPPTAKPDMNGFCRATKTSTGGTEASRAPSISGP